MEKKDFDLIFSYRSREEISADPSCLIPMMMDAGFGKADILVMRTIVEEWPSSLREFLVDGGDPVVLSRTLADQTGVNETRLRDLLESIADSIGRDHERNNGKKPESAQEADGVSKNAPACRKKSPPVKKSSCSFNVDKNKQIGFLVGARGIGQDLVIPDAIDGIQVIGINDDLFGGRAIRTVKMPVSVTSIGRRAF
ncbi:MAG: hypothetical protein IKG94_03060 [Candidatus Methanomethylophilaceae archaeon]|nr:hypothetical protein [Candidatus Methanomethylophilaceae archaeon]